MVNVTRRPFADISIDGQIEARRVSARVSKGLNQNYSTADIVLPYAYPSSLKTWSGINIVAGGDRSSAEQGVHFSGHMLDPSLTMWTPRGTLACGTALARAENYVPAITRSLNSLTDIEAIELILDEVGLFDRQIDGHGMRLGTVATEALTWKQPDTALTMLQRIDEIGLGYRTFDTGTTIVRRWVPLTPIGMTPVFSFEEGINCINGGWNKRRVQPAGLVTVNGDGVSATVEQSTPSNLPNTPYSRTYLMIQQQALSEGIMSAEAMALYLLAKLTRSLVTAQVITWVDRIFSPGQVVFFKSEHVMVEQNFFIQQVITSFEGAKFRQQLELISELDERTTPSGFTPIGTIDPGTMTPIDPIEPLPPGDFPPITPPTPADPRDVTAAITILAIDYELIVEDGAEVPAYIVHAKDASVAYQGSIASRAWTASGPVLAGWETGTGAEFITTFTSLTNAIITLEITTSGGATATATKDVGLTPGVVTKTLELFLAAGEEAESWDPDTSAWNVDAQSAAASVVDVANGPAWTLAESSLNIMWSTNYLETSATEETIPWTDGSTAGVRSWIEPDVDEQLVAVVGSVSEVAFSVDRGDTWTVKDGPGGVPKDIVISRFVAGQVHVLTSTGYYVSDNFGDAWRTVRLFSGGKWLILSHTRNMAILETGELVAAEDGTVQTGPSNVVTAAAHIREDRFVALTADAHVWRTTDSGGTVMEDIGPISSVPVHSYRHGSIPDFYAYAAGTDGAYKLILRVNDGPTYEIKELKIREPGVGNSNAAADYTRIGVGRMVDPGTVVAPPGETSPPGTPGGCVGVVVPLAFTAQSGTTKAINLTQEESRTEPIFGLGGQFIFSPNTNVIHAVGFSTIARTEDGDCTLSTFGGFGLSGGSLWVLDCFNHFYGISSGGSAGVWFSSDGLTYTQLPGGTVSGVGPSSICAGDNKIWMLIGTQVYWMPRAGGPPVPGGYSAGQPLAGSVQCGRTDDSYCIISYNNVISGDTWFRITTASYENISGSIVAAGPVSVGNAPIVSIDGTTWIGIGSQGFIRSVNKGSTWTIAQAATPASVTRGRQHLSYSVTQDRWWATGPKDGGGASRVWYSDDDGVSWTALLLITTTDPIAAVGSSP